MSTDDLTQDANAVDVSKPETHFQVQCTEVRLLSSLLEPVEFKEGESEPSHFVFKIDGSVEGDTAYSCLDVQVISINSETEGTPSAYELRFRMLGLFIADESVQPEALANFVRMYTLSILWPYAREYTSDQLRRAGQPFEALPIINPQVVTEKLIEGGLVKIEISSPDTQTTEGD